MIHEEVFRNELIEALRRELVGPPWSLSNEVDPAEAEKPGGVREVLQESPVQRYSAGVLFPQDQPIIEVEDADAAPANSDEPEPSPEVYVDEQIGEPEREGRGSDAISDAYDETVRLANEFFPAAIGLTCVVRVPTEGLIISARAAIYKSRAPASKESKLREWQRSALAAEPVVIKIPSGKRHGIESVQVAERLLLRAIYHLRKDGTYLITFSLLNTKLASRDQFPSGADCFFQTEFEVRAADGAFAFQEYRSIGRAIDDPEEASLELLYRNRRAYAAGHGCAADWGEEKDGHVQVLRSCTLPAFKVAPVEPRRGEGPALSMHALSGSDTAFPPASIPTLLSEFADEYEAWIDARESEAENLEDRHRKPALANLSQCRICIDRIRGGVALLAADPEMLTAFALANNAMLMQQYHSRREKRTLKQAWQEFPSTYAPTDDERGRWRTFQLAFILMNLNAIASNDDAQRSLVDVIWFPTGGGKTEAYLGLATCDIFYRRLKKPSNAGCTVLMRYTLRLLTAQQFQRASSLICACEVLRRADPAKLGSDPITIGLWVGQSLTPTRRPDAIKAANALADNEKQSENPFQLLKCPWCGTEMDNRDKLGYLVHTAPRTVIFVCPEHRCVFSSRDRRLPVLVVDEDIYDAPPTLIIGTVDKFAMLAWRREAGSIFGIGSENDPPDLIIQDELHLISGPLGSVVGLYESIIDLLCSKRGRAPKIIASTATIRRASQQCRSLYDRPASQFPPQGLDISDSYFAVENGAAPGRIYAGVFASAAPSFVTAMVRTLSSLLQSCKSVKLPPGATESVRDPYWTVLQYFNSLRELGHAATLVEADIPEYMWAIVSRDKVPKELCRRHLSGEELTSRRTADEIPKILERLEIRYPRSTDDAPSPLDTLLATNMISVGVDISRLGLMAVAGQPKTTSEYIQATSRVGRSDKAPGLVVTLYNPGKPRDRSHYEHFRSYHSAFYRFVEPTSVTPFSIPVLDRALHAVIVVVARYLAGVDSPDAIDLSAHALSEAIGFLHARCQRADPAHKDILSEKIHLLLRQWEDLKPSEWGRFGRPPENRPLMYPAGTDPRPEWDVSWPTPTSMRNVDVECVARVVAIYRDPNS